MKKKIFISVGVFFVLLIAALVAVPFLFKDDIKKLIDEQIAANIDADVIYSPDALSLSLIKHFPELSVSISDIAVVGKGDFAADTLCAFKEFGAGLDLMSVIGGENIKVNSVYLIEPRAKAIILENGKANYDIVKDTTTTPEATPAEPSKPVTIQIKKMTVEGGDIIFHDKQAKMFASIKGLDLEASADLGEDIYDSDLEVGIKEITYKDGNSLYLNKNSMGLKMGIKVDSPNSRYEFKDSKFSLNDFMLAFSGNFTMLPEDKMGMDITFASENNEFKSLLSLVPKEFLTDINDLKTSGVLGFNGSVKGTYDEKADLIPTFDINLDVQKGMFQYPSLPSAVQNVNMKVNAKNTDGKLDNTTVDVSTFHIDFGSNPLDGSLKLVGLTNYTVDAKLKTKLNLEELSKMFPMDSMEVKGLFELDLSAQGKYDESGKPFPKLKMIMKMTDGFLKTSAYPNPIEKISLDAKVMNQTAAFEDTQVEISKLGMSLEGEPFDIKGSVAGIKGTPADVKDLKYDFFAKGKVDLGKMMKIYPIEGMELAGMMGLDVQTSGQLADVMTEQYGKTATRGAITINDLVYSSPDMPATKITSAQIDFDPSVMKVTNSQGFLGKSDFKADGSFSNYMAYVLTDNGLLKGNLNFSSQTFDVNEWMTEDKTTAPAAGTPPPAESTGAVEIPKTIDMVLNTQIKSVLYDKLTLSDMKGKVIMRNGIMLMDGLTFNSMGGLFSMGGSYDASDPKKPAFDFTMDIKDLMIQQAYAGVNSIRQMAPLAENLHGKTSTKLKISGLLTQDMMPDLSKLSGLANLMINGAAIKGMASLDKVAALMKSEELKNPELKEVDAKAEIANGRVNVKPFDFKIGPYKATMFGSSGLDGSLDYKLDLLVPVHLLPSEFQSAYGLLADKERNVKMKFDIGGVSNSPKVALSKDMIASAKDAIKDKISEEKDKITDALIDNGKGIIKDALLGKDSTGKSTGVTDVKDKVKDGVKDLLKDKPWKKK